MCSCASGRRSASSGSRRDHVEDLSRTCTSATARPSRTSASSACRRAARQTANCRRRLARASVIRSHAVIYAGNVIGRNFQTGNKVNIRELERDWRQRQHRHAVGRRAPREDRRHVRIHTQAFVPEYLRARGGLLDRPECRADQRQVPPVTWREGPTGRSGHPQGREDRREQHHSSRRGRRRKRPCRCRVGGRPRRARRCGRRRQSGSRDWPHLRLTLLSGPTNQFRFVATATS